MTAPPGYALKRLLVMAFCGFNILSAIIIAALSKIIAHNLLEKQPKWHTLKPDEQKLAETIAIVGIVVGSVIAILFQLFGLIGALKENVCLTITYLVVQSINAFYSVIRAIAAPFYWPGAICAVLTTLVVFLFMRDLRAMRNGPQQRGRPYYA